VRARFSGDPSGGVQFSVPGVLHGLNSLALVGCLRWFSMAGVLGWVCHTPLGRVSHTVQQNSAHSSAWSTFRVWFLLLLRTETQFRHAVRFLPMPGCFMMLRREDPRGFSGLVKGRGFELQLTSDVFWWST